MLFGAYSLNKFNPEMKPSPHSLNHSLPLPHFLNHSLISASLPHRRRNSAQIAAHSLNHFLPLSHTYLCLFPSSLSSSFGTLSVLILLSFMSIFIFCPIFKGNQVYFSNKNNNQERERKKSNLCFLCIIVC